MQLSVRINDISKLFLIESLEVQWGLGTLYLPFHLSMAIKEYLFTQVLLFKQVFLA